MIAAKANPDTPNTKPHLLKYIAIFLIIIALIIASCAGLRTCVSIPNTPFEYDHHMQLLESEELLGKTKEEVMQVVGFPDGWQPHIRTQVWPNSYDLWEDDIHVWGYSSEKEGVHLSLNILFSDEKTVEQVYFLWSREGTYDTWSECQGIKSEYFWH